MAEVHFLADNLQPLPSTMLFRKLLNNIGPNSVYGTLYGDEETMCLRVEHERGNMPAYMSENKASQTVQSFLASTLFRFSINRFIVELVGMQDWFDIFCLACVKEVIQ